MEEPAAHTAVLPAARPSRKIVTALFVDVVGSTSLAERLDVEAYRALMERYFAEASAVIGRHGGFLEKFIGDAVMAVFGVPDLHEDDALRAVSAAVEIRARLAALAGEFEGTWGVAIAVRTGVDSGEAVVSARGTGDLSVAGPALSTAARLEQLAAPGEVLIGEAVYPLVRAAVVADPVGPVELRGTGRETTVWRVHDVVPGAAGWTRRLDSPLVDRTSELADLLAAFDRVPASGAQLVTVLGPAGVGKSRLGQELVARLGGRACRLQGRCLPYGDGVTFWPVVEVLRDAAGVLPADSRATGLAKLRALLADQRDADLVLDRLAGLLGDSEVQPAVQEIFWAVRRLLETVAARTPVVVLLDDIHWGEPTFLDLVEYLTEWMPGAPVLLVCLARPELLESRPGWSAGRPNATHLSLDSLTDAETRELVEHLAEGPVAPDVASRISRASEGNPLFVEEILRMLVDTGELRAQDGQWQLFCTAESLSIPSTVHALVSARLDRLEPDESLVLDRAAVVGKEFGWGEVVALLDEPRLTSRIATLLQSLLHKQLIRPHLAEPGAEDSFAFTHTAIRDTAYQRIAKSDRAMLHERFADWLAETYRGRAGDYEEVIGHHLEQALRTLLDLGPPSARTRELAGRAAGPLSVAGRRAFARGDMPAAVNLLRRTADLAEPGAPQRATVLPELAFALMETGDFPGLLAVVAELQAAAGRDVATAGSAAVLGLWVRLFTDPVGWTDVAQQETARAAEAFRQAGDERGMARVSSLRGVIDLLLCRYGDAERHWTQASEHARAAGDHRDELDSLAWVPLTLWAGTTPTEEGLVRCRELRRRVDGDKKAMASTCMAEALFEAGRGRFEEARRSVQWARGLLEDVALAVWLAGPYAQMAGWVELLAGAPAEAEAVLRPAFERLQEMGEMSWLSTNAGILAEAVHDVGRYDEAQRLAEVARETAAPHDVYSQVLWRTVAAKVAARQGRTGDAQRLADEAVELVTPTDFLHLQWHTFLSLARVLADAGRPREAAEAAARAAGIASAKGATAGRRTAEDLLGR
jgi:class 3 adenylate cyclase/tetratricopeptide (TPR) repeat protein